MKTIALAGLPNSGKSTTARALAKELGAVYVPEIARIYIIANGGINNERDQMLVTKLQYQLEKEMNNPNDPRYLISDSPTFLGDAYHRVYWDNKDSILTEIAAKSQYDKLYWLDQLSGPLDDGVRYQKCKDEIDQLYYHLMNQKRDYIKVPIAPLEQRVKMIIEDLKNE